MATAQSQIAHALLIQFEFVHRKPVMMHTFHDVGGELAIVRAREKAGKTLGAKFNIRAFHDAVLELGSVPLPVVTARVDRFITDGGKGLTRTWSE